MSTTSPFSSFLDTLSADTPGVTEFFQKPQQPPPPPDQDINKELGYQKAEEDKAAAHNITAKYDAGRLKEVGDIIQKPGPDGRVQVEEDPRFSVVSMKEAIAIADDKKHDYHKRTDLSDKQKFLIDAVAEERKTAAGRELTGSAAGRDEWLAVDNNVDYAGAHHDKDSNYPGLTTINQYDRLTPAQQGLHHQLVAHHEETHSLQEVRAPMPDGLSSYDQKLWYLGREGQAYVAEQDENARRTSPNHQGLTDEQKRKVFSDYVSEQGYAKHYDIENTTRTDGRKLTVDEYEKAFGFVPGHEKDVNGKDANFLKGGKYTDVAEIVKGGGDSTGPFAEARREADQKPIKYEDLPVASMGSSNYRFDSKDKNYVVMVSASKDGSKAHVDVYKLKHLPQGDGYVLADSKNVTAEEDKKWNRDHKGEKNAPIEASYIDIFHDTDTDRDKTIRIDLRKEANGQVYAKGYDTDANNPNDRGRDYALEQHQNTMHERLNSASIKDYPSKQELGGNRLLPEQFVADSNSLPSDLGGANRIELPDNVKAAASEVADRVRNTLGLAFSSGSKLSMPSAENLQDIASLREVMSDARGVIAGGSEATLAQNNAYAGNAAMDAAIRGRNG